MVVAIIGVLATIVLGSLGEARSRAQDTKIKALMAQMRTQAEIFYLDNNAYGGPNFAFEDSINECSTSIAAGLRPNFENSIFDPNAEENISALLREVADISENNAFRVRCAIGASPQSWAFSAPLANPETGFTGWCVDSSGNSKDVGGSFTGGGSGGLLSNGFAMCP